MAPRHTTYLHWQSEELEIRHPEWMPAELARIIIEDLRDAGPTSSKRSMKQIP